MRLNLLMSFAYCYDYPIEIFVACTVEGQVSRDDERYLYFTCILLKLLRKYRFVALKFVCFFFIAYSKAICPKHLHTHSI